MSGARIDKTCPVCGSAFSVRLADHKRGWGKFCSKSCKGVEQTRRTGRGAPIRYEGMSQAELAGGGYGGSERDDPFTSDKW